VSPRPRLADERRPAILAAAVEVIRERGLEHARVADVAKRVGTSAPAVLYWFASKGELLHEALTTAEERFYAELSAELAELGSARERLVRVIESWCGEGDYDAALWMELWARALRDHELAATRTELDQRWRREIAAIVREGQEKGEFGPADPEDVAVVLCALLDGLMVQITLGDPETRPERARELALRLAGRELGCELDSRRMEVTP
jgi:AcrR family transcriptional regulator